MTTPGEENLDLEIEGETPREIYDAALQERKSKSNLKKREACEKAWLAVVKAVDAYLDKNDLHVDTGSRDAFSERRVNLGKLASKGNDAKRLSRLNGEASDYLHVAGFHEGKELDYIDVVFKETVQEILELTDAD
ncbi:MAG TPA: PaREP1 family protein [Candidatus Lokiarchaeia archaeon]|nr:PaREP1 family protein [Candidatus Lokiarchaeia archaeon]